MHAVTVHPKCISHLNRVQEPLFRLACGEGDLPIVWCQHHSNREQTPNLDDICINAYVGCRQRVFFFRHMGHSESISVENYQCSAGVRKLKVMGKMLGNLDSGQYQLSREAMLDDKSAQNMLICASYIFIVCQFQI